MFPLKADDPYINKNGSRTTLGDITGDISGIEDDIDALDGKIDDVADSITPISQTGTKATTAITAGTQFYLNGNLVKAKTNIAIGDTFTSGTNYDDAGDITTQIGNLTTRSTFLQRTIYSSEGVSVAANSYATDTIDIAYEGYTPIYFAPAGTNHNDSWVTVSSISSTTVTIIVRSISAQTVKGAINVLYQKSV